MQKIRDNNADIILSLALALLCNHSAIAQSDESFFLGDYAKTPLDNHGGNIVEPHGDWQADEKPIESETEESEPKENEEQNLPQLSEEQAAALAKIRERAEQRVRPDTTVAPTTMSENEEQEILPTERTEPGIPVEKLGVILNARNKNHFQQTMDELINIANKYDFTLGNIYLVGAPKADESIIRIFGNLSFRGARMQIRGKVPAEYPVTSSPSWIVSTAHGEVLLEGTGPLAKFFNTKGEYLDPMAKPSDPKAQPNESAASPDSVSAPSADAFAQPQ